MEKYELGPNGGLVFCMELLKENLGWLISELEQICYNAEEGNRGDENEKYSYIIIDCPGQVELFSHHTVVQEIVHSLQKALDVRLCSVQLIDSFYCSQPATFISAALLVTATMLRLELPHVNVLTKIDLLKQYGQLPFELNFFTDMLNLAPLLQYVQGRIPASEDLAQRELRAFETSTESKQTEDSNSNDDDGETGSEERRTPSSGAMGSMMQKKYKALTAAFCELVDDYALVSFLPLNIEDAETVGRVLAATDRANGYSYVHALAASSETNSTGTTVKSKNTDEATRLREYYYQFASDQVESSVMMALEIQEKYGSS
jgi:hypothetical protein